MSSAPSHQIPYLLSKKPHVSIICFSKRDTSKNFGPPQDHPRTSLTLMMLLSFLAAGPALLLSPHMGGSSMRMATPYMQMTPYDQAVGVTPGVGLAGAVQPTGAPDLASPTTILVQGGSLRTWTYRSPSVEQVQVVLGTEGRPLDAEVDLWHGPDNTPVKMRVYVENGLIRPFNAVIETPRGPNTVAIRNIGQIEFPLAADVSADNVAQPTPDMISSTQTVQGGALRTYPFEPNVDSVHVLLKTDGRPLNARIELLQGPNNNKQVIELYTEDGSDRPFFCTISTPGSGNVVRVVNTAPVEFPMTAAVIPGYINHNISPSTPVIGGDVYIGQ